jgi:phosphatidylinositol-3-phosphatase
VAAVILPSVPVSPAVTIVRLLGLRGAVARATLAAIVLVAAVAVAACGGAAPSTADVASSPARGAPSTAGVCGGRARRLGRLRRVVWVVMENQSYSGVIGSRAAPYINRLADSCGLTRRFSAEAHPSLPNYIAMTSGSTQRIADDDGPGTHRLAGPSIFSQLGTGWRALQESMPRPCAGANSGQYAVRHNPAAYYIRVRAQCAAQDVPLRGARGVTARFTFVTPNLCHDMHSCPVRDGDRWLAGWLPSLLRTRQYRSGSMVVFITWDEDDGSARQHIPTLVISRHTRPGTRSATPFDHYSLLATTEEILGLPKLGAAARAESMRSAFGLS